MIFGGLFGIKYDGYTGIIISSTNLQSTIPKPSYYPWSPVTCVTAPFYGIHTWTCLILLNICELNLPSTCAWIYVSITMINFCGYHLSCSCLNLNVLMLSRLALLNLLWLFVVLVFTIVLLSELTLDCGNVFMSIISSSSSQF